MSFQGKATSSTGPNRLTPKWACLFFSFPCYLDKDLEFNIPATTKILCWYRGLSTDGSQHQLGAVGSPDELNLSYSNTGKVGLGLLVHQPGFLSSCMLGVLRAALQVGNNCITINLQLESLAGRLIWSLYKSCWRRPSSAPDLHIQSLRLYRKLQHRDLEKEFWPMSLAPESCTQT